jgi:ABC-2 type transport system ATP-binding protein
MPGSAEPTPAAADGPAEIIRADGVTRRFGSLAAVSDVSFNVSAGDIVGLVGSDGAGKTTLLRMLAAMLAPSSGTIRVGGLDVVRERSGVKEMIGYMPQRFGLYQDLTVAENLDFFMDIYGITGAERRRRSERYLGFSNLLPFTDRRAGDLSGGMKQKLGLACVLVHEPRVLILDEPTNGVDPVSRQEFWQILAEMKQRHDDPGVDGLSRRGRALRPAAAHAQCPHPRGCGAGAGPLGCEPGGGHDPAHPGSGRSAHGGCLWTLTP